MRYTSGFVFVTTARLWMIVFLIIGCMGSAFGADLQEIKARGVLRHLGVPYARFVTGDGDGLDTELIKLFAQHLGVQYEYVKTSWNEVIGDLTGKQVQPRGDDIEILGDVPVRGDLIANGLTMLAWREKILAYSVSTFPTGVWLVVRADSPLHPITPSGDIHQDIVTVKTMIQGHSVLAKEGTCLDPHLNGLYETGADVRLFSGILNELAPAVINQEAEMTILDVPDALIALQKWPGKIKIIGPVTAKQEMGVGFAKTSPELREAFNRFFRQCQQDGTYVRLVKKYYPAVLRYYAEFFEEW